VAYKLEVDHPDFPKDWEFDCDGILVPNGGSVTLTKEDELAFLSRWGQDVKHFYGHGTVAKVTGASLVTAKELKDARGDQSETVETNETDDGGET
jgi:hypothetical protein